MLSRTDQPQTPEPPRPRFRSGNSILQDFIYLTRTISFPSTKPSLREPLARGLCSLGHRRDHVESFLNGFYDPPTEENAHGYVQL